MADFSVILDTYLICVSHTVFNCCYVNGTKFDLGHTQGVRFDLIPCPYGMGRSHLVKHAIVLM